MLKHERGKKKSEIVWVSKVCHQNVDRVSNNDKSCHICSIKLEGLFVKYEKYGTLSL